MTIIINTKKQAQGFWSEKIKAHGVKSGQIVIKPGENQVPNDVHSEIKGNPFFKAMINSGELVLKQDKQALKEAKALADAEAKAAKEAQDAREKVEADKVKALRKQLTDLGVDGRTLKNLTSAELEQKLDEATSPKA